MTKRMLMLLVGWGLSVPALRAGEWPQILGPNRNGVAVDEKIATSFPSGSPKLVFEREIGSGFAGVAVAQGRAILFHRQGNEELVECLEAETGKTLWKTPFPSGFQPQIVDDDGPRCVPVVAGGRVIVYGAEGGLRCLDFKTGKVQWTRECLQEFSAPEGYFGAGATPLVEGKKVLVNVGGQNAGLVAFDLETGKTAWQKTSEQASYSAPIAVTLGETRQAIFVTRLNCVSVNPETGETLFQFPFGARGPTVNGASPVVTEGHLFLTASYGVGARWVKLAESAPQEEWESDEIMSSQYTTPVTRGKMLYGIDGRQDAGVARLRCIDPQTQKVAWTAERFGMATVILAGETLVAMKTDGELALVEATPKAYKPFATAKLLSGTCRALPALANGRLYVRNESELRCYDLQPSR